MSEEQSTLAVRATESAASPTSLGHVAAERWVFDQGVTTVFDDMLARSIPQIEGMRDVVFRTASRFVQPRTDVLDLGCARGDAMARLIVEFGPNNRFVGIDISPSMIAACRERFQDPIARCFVEINPYDLRNEYPPVRASVTLCILTLQFTPVDYRQKLLAQVFAHTLPGGVLLVVEKVLGNGATTDQLLLDLYHEHKRAKGYTKDEIERKRLSLEGVLVPLTAAWNEQLLHSAGFSQVECLWRCLNFAGWVAIKE